MTTGSQRMHSRSNRIMAVVVWCGAGAVVLTQLAAPSAGRPWLVPASTLAAYLAWAALWRPGIRIDDGGVVIRNVSHAVQVPWAALIHVDTRFALTLATPSRRYTVWAAPAPSALRAMFAGRRESQRERAHVGESMRPGDLLGTDSGDAALLVREEWARRIDAGLIEIGIADSTPTRRRWDTTFFTTTAILLAATVATMHLLG